MRKNEQQRGRGDEYDGARRRKEQLGGRSLVYLFVNERNEKKMIKRC